MTPRRRRATLSRPGARLLAARGGDSRRAETHNSRLRTARITTRRRRHKQACTSSRPPSSRWPWPRTTASSTSRRRTLPRACAASPRPIPRSSGRPSGASSASGTMINVPRLRREYRTPVLAPMSVPTKRPKSVRRPQIANLLVSAKYWPPDPRHVTLTPAGVVMASCRFPKATSKSVYFPRMFAPTTQVRSVLLQLWIAVLLQLFAYLCRRVTHVSRLKLVALVKK